MTLSPYYRLLLLASGLVIGATPAQATQSFAATSFWVEETPHSPQAREETPPAIAAVSIPESPVLAPDPNSIAITVIAPPEAESEVEQSELPLADPPIVSAETTLPPVATPILAQPPTEETEPPNPPEPESTDDPAVDDAAPPTESDAPASPALPVDGEPSPTDTLPSFTPAEPPPRSEPPPQAQEPRVLVSEVVITGVTEELELLVYNAIRTEPGRTTTRSQLQEDVNAIYATGFFSNVKVSPSDTPLGVRVTFEVQANPTFTGIDIETVPAIAADKERVLPQSVVDETFADQYGKILNLRDLQEGIKKINEWYSSQGYDLAQVVGSPKIENDGTVQLIIAEGVVENIQVRFFDAEDEPVDGRTRDFIVTREMRLKPGDVFNRNTAQEDLQRVYSLGLFEDVRLSFNPGTDPREVIVNVDVVEGNTGSVAAGAGISSTSGLFGTISYQEKNIGGNNQTLGTEFQLGERELLFDVNFTDPWIGGDPYRTSYSVNAFRRRTISLVFDGNDSSVRTFTGFDSPRIVRTGTGVTFFRPLAKDVFTPPDWRLSAGVGYQNVRVENANGDIQPWSAPLNGFDSQPLSFSPNGVDDLITLSFGASQDNRNSPIQPTSGSIVRFGAEQTVPFGSGSIAMTRLRGAYSYYIPVNWLDLTSFGFVESTQPQTMAFNVQAGTVLGDLPPYEAFILGGSNSVRGYAEGELGNGRSYFQATAEYRFPIISAVGGALFVDYGSNLGSQGAVPGFPAIVRGLPGSGVGYGLGVRIQSPVGPIRIDFGFNGDGDSRVNFGIGQKF
ncbi:MAG: BamA/TamA family outer membrane protein [Synechocystis sp.]